MVGTKKQMVDFIYAHFTRKSNGKKIPKAELNKQNKDFLYDLISKDKKIEARFIEEINRPPLKNFFVSVKEGNKEVVYKCSNVSEEEVRKQFLEDEKSKGSKVLSVVPVKGHHICQYCNGVAEGSQKDLLCDECRELFGHSLYSEL